jgi:FlaA1/EpsC-like NDP-sugar epimerase
MEIGKMKKRKLGESNLEVRSRHSSHSLGEKRSSRMKLWFENKVALVTGAGQGMGLAAARAFAEEGAAVALADRDEALVRKATKDLTKKRTQGDSHSLRRNE